MKPMHTKSDLEVFSSASAGDTEPRLSFSVEGYELQPSEFAEYSNLRSGGLDSGEALSRIARYFFRRVQLS